MGWIEELNLDIDVQDVEQFDKWEQKLSRLAQDKRTQIIPVDKDEPSPLEVRKRYIESALDTLDEDEDTIYEYARRMIRNWDYDPTDPVLDYWDDKCHCINATKGPDERDENFKAVVRFWVAKKKIIGYVDSPKGGTYIRKAREMADKGRFKYEDWVLAQAIHYPRCYMKHLVYKKAPDITRQWIRGGRYRPALFNI